MSTVLHASTTARYIRIVLHDTTEQLRAAGDGCTANEETLAYIVGDLTTEVFGALHRAGVWTTDEAAA